MRLAWGKKVNLNFVTKLTEICDGFGWPPEFRSFLMACIAFESGETFSPSVKNKAGSGATGLIQFMPTTCLGLGVTVAQMAAMSATDQLEYVRLYFVPYAHRIRDLPSMYMAILLPKYVAADNDAILFSGGTTAYRQNSGLDINSDGEITKEEAASRVQAKLEKGLLAEYAL